MSYYKFRWTKAYTLAVFTALKPHTSAGMNIKDALLQKNYDYGHLLYVLFLQPQKLNIHI